MISGDSLKTETRSYKTFNSSLTEVKECLESLPCTLSLVGSPQRQKSALIAVEHL